MNPLAALQNFYMEYSGNDHHIRCFGVTMDTEKGNWSAHMEDGSGHKGTGTAGGKSILVPQQVLDEMQKKNLRMVADFMIGMKKGDHHLAHAGLSVAGGEVIYDLSDKHDNHAVREVCQVTITDGKSILQEVKHANMGRV